MKFLKQNDRRKISDQVCAVSFLMMLLTLAFSLLSMTGPASELSSMGIHVIPYPQKVNLGGEEFFFSDGHLTIVAETGCSANDMVAAEELKRDLDDEFQIKAVVTSEAGDKSIILKRDLSSKLPEQGYRIDVFPDKVVIRSGSEAGLFYGTQTFIQLLLPARGGYRIPGMEITDWPDIQKRAVHYDTKHHQDKISYVKDFIRDLARYKINQLVWEWEDKFAYQGHPEIGASGAFSLEQMQEITRYARKYHIELVPLVQGLGHVSYILKWPQHSHLREIAASNWEFCPLKDGTYDLLFDLWDEAIKATPGSTYIHIGSDEAYELATCKSCGEEAGKIGKSGVYLLFINQAARYLQSKGRKVMVWERPMGWKISPSPAVGIEPDKNIVFIESHVHDNLDLSSVTRAKEIGFEVYGFDPNPGIEHLFLPYHFRQRSGKRVEGSLENSYKYLASAALSRLFDGIINPSWDDSGLHNQIWMMSFVTTAEYSWSGSKPTLQAFEESFFKSYYGQSVLDMQELYSLLNEGSYYYSGTFERNVWHHGEIGKTHLPDLPRNDNIEYDPFWNSAYKEKIKESKEMLAKMNRVLQIVDNNKAVGVRHAYDFEIYRTIAELVRHTCLTYKDLSDVEYAIAQAQRLNDEDKQKACEQLIKVKTIIVSCLQRRDKVYNDLVGTWEKTRLPKGMSSPGKKCFHQQDRARHFANRTADMSYLIYDEQLLDLEGYLQKLKEYIAYYKEIWLAY